MIVTGVTTVEPVLPWPVLILDPCLFGPDYLRKLKLRFSGKMAKHTFLLTILITVLTTEIFVSILLIHGPQIFGGLVVMLSSRLG